MTIVTNLGGRVCFPSACARGSRGARTGRCSRGGWVGRSGRTGERDASGSTPGDTVRAERDGVVLGVIVVNGLVASKGRAGIVVWECITARAM